MRVMVIIKATKQSEGGEGPDEAMLTEMGRFNEELMDAGLIQSMGSRGDCFDNAMAESFFATLECELLDKHRFRTRDEARTAVFDFIEGWYNTGRRHSALRLPSLGMFSPAKFEVQWLRTQAASSAK